MIGHLQNDPHTVTRLKKLVKPREARKIAEFVISDFPNDDDDVLTAKTTEILKFVQNARLSKKYLSKANMILRGKLPNIITEKHLFQKDTYVLDWSFLA